ncbi:MAG: hypothetical protein JWM52_238 [Candidatus Saccharibacteria bacterium]|nr:hypothetical protein [Candidatus Saccharibacteria bacterium]
MQKDVIYIDVDDDVTAIIGKIKKSKEKIVAIVPPKRAGALQSAVNLRLLDRMAKTSKKNLVLVTSNPALIALAANASIPVAKNLQSKPEIADIPALAVDDGDDIIDGADLPVGDHAKTVKVSDNTRVEPSEGRSDVVEGLDIDGEEVAAVSIASSALTSKKVANARSKIKIPNFDKFRKRLFLGIAGGVALTALLIWMFGFAPSATVIITAKTSPAPVSATVKLGGTAATDFKTGVIKSVLQSEKKDVSVDFDATGTGTVGDKASGTVIFKNCEDSAAITIPAGTTVSTGAHSYVTQTAVTVPGGSGSFSGCTTPGTSTAVQIVAAAIGDDYNMGNGTTFAVSGHPNGSTSYMRAVANSDIAGGSSKTVKVVSSDDIERAKGQLIGQSTDAEKKALIKKFVSGEKVIDSSFTVDRSEAVSTPTVDKEAPASGKAKLTISTNYSIYAVPKTDLENYLNESIKTQLTSQTTQKVYNTGIDKASISNFRKDGDTLTASVASNGQIGPVIDEDTIKDKVKGKIYGEVQSALQTIDGVQDVDVQFPYFWVRAVPNDTNKIHIEFKIQDEN